MFNVCSVMEVLIGIVIATYSMLFKTFFQSEPVDRSQGFIHGVDRRDCFVDCMASARF